MFLQSKIRFKSGIFDVLARL